MNSDVTKPNLINIEGRCYRTQDVRCIQSYEESFEEGDYNADPPVNSEDNESEVIQLENGKFAASFHVPGPYLGAIIGTKGSVKKRIEFDTKTEIKIPKYGDDGDVLVNGSSRVNVIRAFRRIKMIVISTRLKRRPTHFVSLPMTTAEIQENFNLLKNKILEDSKNDPRINEEIFTPVQRLHLTATVFCLMDESERNLASDLLKEVVEETIKPLLKDKKIMVRVKGLSYMNDDPHNIHVLYADAEDENDGTLLQKIINEIRETYIKNGFATKLSDNVKIHVTIMNVRNTLECKEKKSKPQPFDGSEILKKYGDYYFGVQEVKSIHLSTMHCHDDTGYYQSRCVINL